MDLHTQCVNTIKGLAMDGVQRANSGHPGMPMGMASASTVLWRKFLVHDPADPAWPDRDRFVLSAGHGSMLLYSLLHLSGYEVSLDDLKAFRQWGSKTPGHPEYGHTPGVETTTGPLGQGFANAVGMAMAERVLRETFGADLCDHWIYGICGDGDLQEGVAAEAASLAGHLRLGRLVMLYDDNKISIDGATDLSFTEDVARRFEAYGWHVVHAEDGHDPIAVQVAIEEARAVQSRPSLVICPTIIGEGSSKQGSEKTHGSPLGAEDVAGTKARLGMDPSASFVVPETVREAFHAHPGAELRAAWEARYVTHPRRAELDAFLARDPEAAIAAAVWPAFEVGKKLATRKANQAVLRALSKAAPWLIGGSADLTGSNGTDLGSTAISPARFAQAPMIHFGVREHGMAAIANGMALHGGVRPFVATFLVFHDYMRPSVRLSALMKQPVIYVYSHDSVFLGEDGPTHQPIETLAALRALPGMTTWRPADATETAACWKAMLRHDGPSAIVITRQDLPILAETQGRDAEIASGGYLLRDADGAPDVVLVATGSEVPLALDAAALLAARGVGARVLSLPCVERFLAQPAAARAALLPPGVPRVSIEAATTFGWERLVGEAGLSIGIDTFGYSAPAEVIAEQLGFTAPQVADRVAAFLGR